jgi:hypothetical protein
MLFITTEANFNEKVTLNVTQRRHALIPESPNISKNKL